MKKLFFIVSLSLFLLTTVGTTSAVSFRTVTGFVYDSISGLSIPNHTVYFYYSDSGIIHQDSAVTAQGGLYAFDYVLTDTIGSILKVSTFGCNNQKYEQVFQNPGAIEFAFFTICFLSPTPNCQASFTHLQDSLYPLKVHFINTSTGLINNWLWDFGDGTTSTLSNPTHTYIQPGTYQVSLQVGNTMNPLYSSAVIQSLVISPMYILAGQVMANQFPVHSQAKVILYRIIGPQWISIDTSVVDSSGVYYFYQIPEGTYSLRAIPTDPELAKDYFPTYFQQSLTWQEATLISLHDSIYTNSFGLIKKPVASGGTGVLTGHIVFTNGTSTVPAPEIELIVLSTSHEGINAAFSSVDGSFLVGGLMPGDYLYHAEIPGNSSTEYVLFTIGAPGSDTVVVNLFLQNNAIGMDDPEAIPDALKCYPNPTPGVLFIEFESTRTYAGILSIMDFTGRTVLNEDIRVNKGSNRIEKDFSGFTSGLYIVTIDLGKAGRITRKILH